ncbi:DUF4150 domain-containing protein [Vibrio rotiferianus]|uniref:DUF4150 domain-containing protein n=1 Tax=Vibrio rotiferianus TaxID=190895 RepID=UPI003392C96A
MAKQFVARKTEQQKVICMAPDVCLTQVGNAVVPLPYQISESLDKAENTAKTVLFNSGESFVKNSDSKSVTGDTKGSVKGGVVSGTKGAKSEPLSFSSSVMVEGQALLRVGDLVKMNNGNTIGKVQGNESGSAARINDDGKVEGSTTTSEYDKYMYLFGDDVSDETRQKIEDKFGLDNLFPETSKFLDSPKEYAQNVWAETQQQVIGSVSDVHEDLTQFYQEFKNDPFTATKNRIARKSIEQIKALSDIGDSAVSWGNQQVSLYSEAVELGGELLKDGEVERTASILAASVMSTAADIFEPRAKLKVIKKLNGRPNKGSGNNNQGKDGAKSKGVPCRSITIDLDCTGYPKAVPLFTMKASPSTWEVRSKSRTDTRNKLVGALSLHLEKTRTLNNAVNRQFQKAYDISPQQMSSMGIKEFTDTLKKEVGSSLKGGPNSALLPIHHLQPSWAGGLDSGDNLAPLDYYDHTAAGNPNTIHKWWNRKLKGQQESLRKKLKACDKKRASSGHQSKKNGKNKNKNKSKNMEDFMKNKDGTTRDLTERSITQISRKLTKLTPPVTLEIEMTCPEATP